MLSIFLNTLPFFALIALGYGAARVGLFSQEATQHLTRFVFYFALSAMLFRFAANLSLSEVLDGPFMLAYAIASLMVYGVAFAVARVRNMSMDLSLIEAQSSVIGNMGWMGLAMLPILLGPSAVAPVMMVLIVDLILFGPLAVILIVGLREGRLNAAVFGTIGKGLLKNPMVMSISLGLAWAALGWTVPAIANQFLDLLAGASTPGALFAIGASMAFVTVRQFQVPAWLSLNKLVIHPLIAGCVAVVWFDLDPFVASVMMASAAMPVAGNVFMMANHYGIDGQRVSVAILISTAVSILTIPLWIEWSQRLLGL